MVEGIPTIAKGTVLDYCEACAKGKQHKEPISKEPMERAKEPLGRVHMDLQMVPETSLGGARYKAVFVDDYSRVWNNCLPFYKGPDKQECYGLHCMG